MGTSNTANINMGSYNLDDSIKLFGKDDVFNYDLSPHQIETELLCSERLYFSVKFSTEKRDLTLKMIKLNQETHLTHTSMSFVTGYYQQIEGPAEKVDKKKASQMNVQLDSQKAKKEILVKNDLQEKVLPKIPSEYLNLQANPTL